MFALMRTVRFSLLAMILAAALSSVTKAAEALSSEVRADFEWFSGLGFPDVKDKPFVKFFPGAAYQNLEESRSDSFQYGFLVSRNGTSFTVLDSNLRQHTFTNFPARPPQRIQEVFGATTNVFTFYYKAGELTKLDLKTVVNEFLTEQDKAKDYAVINPFRYHYPDGWLATRASFFVLAWDCWRQGLTDEARRMYAVAEKIGGLPRNEDAGDPFRQRLTRDLAGWQLGEAMANFNDTNFTRKDLLAPFQSVIKNYPGTEQAARAKDIADRLTTMIGEDEVHAHSKQKTFDQMTTDEKVAALVFELRDQGAGLMDEREAYMDTMSTNSPASQLIKIGYPAVPRLIAVLDDRRLVRMADPEPESTISTVGDCAADILNTIGGRRFYTRATTRSHLSTDGNVTQVRRDAQAWWNELQGDGERQTLIHDTEAGDSPDQARALWDKYPDAAPDAVIKGIQASKKYWTRDSMLQLLGRTNTPEANDFLEKQMHEALDESSRVTAATLLRDRGRTDATELMIKVWTNHQDKFNLLISFLAKSESPAAIEALVRNVRSRSIWERWQIMEACAGAGHSRNTAVAAAAEKALVSSLDDTDETSGSYWWNGDIGAYNNPRICDRAGMLLNQLWPERYQFNLLASPKVREQQLVDCQNAWRKANGLSPLPLPEARKEKVARREANKVTEVVWANNSIKPDDAFTSQLENLKGKLLTGSNVVDIMTSYISQLATKNIGIDLTIRKDEDLTGVRLAVSLQQVDSAGRSRDWQRNRTFKLGRQDLIPGGGGMFLDYARKASDWEDVNRAFASAVAADPKTPYYLHLKVFTSQPGPQDPNYEHLAGPAW